MIVSGGDDLVERGRAFLVPVELDHGFEVVRRDRVVHRVLGDVAVHVFFSAKAYSSTSACRIGASRSIKGSRSFSAIGSSRIKRSTRSPMKKAEIRRERTGASSPPGHSRIGPMKR